MGRQYIGADLVELVKHLGKEQRNRWMVSCEGQITSVDPQTYMAKVMLEPWGIETGWLPLGTMSAGNGWGLFHLPPDETEVVVDFIGGDVNNGRVRCVFHNDTDAPIAGLVQGEILLKHSSGSLLHFDADGNVNLVVANDLNAVVQGDTQISALGDITVVAQGDATITAQGDCTAAVEGDATIGAGGSVSIAGGDVAVNGGTVTLGSRTIIDGRPFLAHTHSGVQSGPGLTGPVT
jgi:phage baseplate assembly protein V